MKSFNLKKKFYFLFIIFIILFLLIEIFLRLLNVEYPIFQKHDEIRGFSLLPNSSGTWRKEGKGKVEINSDGLRDFNHKFNKDKDTYRIAILGDSFAEARSVNLNETFWSKISSDLINCSFFKNTNKEVEIINFGVSEYGTAQQLLTLKNHVWKYDPDLILLTFFSGNDVSDNHKLLSRKKYRPYYYLNNENLILDNSFINTKPYKILSSFWGRSFIRISQYSRIAQLIRESYVQYYFKSQRQKNNISKSKQFKNKNKSNVYNPVNKNWSDAWLITEKIIGQINKEINSNKKDFILVSLSNPIQVHPSEKVYKQFLKKNDISDIFYPENRLEEFSKRNNIKYIQISKRMRSVALKNNVFFHGFENTKLGIGHWNILGHKTAGEIISQDVCKFLT